MSKQSTTTNKVISGQKVDFKKCTQGLGEFYFENADKHADCIFQIDAATGQKETFASMKKRSIRLAVSLKKIGVTSKDVILICSKNTMDSNIPHISTLYLGAKIGGLHPAQSTRDWVHCINLVQPTFIFVEEECVESMEISVQEIVSKPQLIVFGKSEKYKTFDDLLKLSGISDETPTFVPTSVTDCHETAIIIFSSGTTGPPKGMSISHYSLINRALTAVGTGSAPRLVGITYSTLFWISSILQIAISFHSGSTNVIPSPVFNPVEMLEIIEKFGVTFLFINPVLLRPLLMLEDTEKYDTSSLKMLTTVGTPLNPKENQILQKVFKNTFITQAYGCSETMTNGTNFNVFRDKKFLHKLSSVGRCSDNCQIKVVNPDTQEVLGPNASGEIYIKTPFMMNGYYNGYSSDVFDENDFFKTGDLGYFDEDECFYITGRIKETFKYRTYHIPTNHLESILMEHPAVFEAAVFGIPHPEEGHHPAACIVLKEGTNATLEDIEEYYTKNVSEWHKLRGGIKVVKILPKTPTSKIQKSKLIHLFESC